MVLWLNAIAVFCGFVIALIGVMNPNRDPTMTRILIIATGLTFSVLCALVFSEELRREKR